MRMSDLITNEIIRMLNDSSENTTEIQRNEMANEIGCVPSQINYVLSSRFTPEHGYIIESRRGGGGFIRITRVKLDRSSAIMHIVNSIGEKLDEATARIVIENCLASNLITDEGARLTWAALSAPIIKSVPQEYRETLRAAIMKRMLLAQV